ncbi:MAG: hypothetical protein AAGM38_05205 [Pseudomonadota bacterium]
MKAINFTRKTLQVISASIRRASRSIAIMAAHIGIIIICALGLLFVNTSHLFPDRFKGLSPYVATEAFADCDQPIELIVTYRLKKASTVLIELQFLPRGEFDKSTNGDIRSSLSSICRAIGFSLDSPIGFAVPAPNTRVTPSEWVAYAEFDDPLYQVKFAAEGDELINVASRFIFSLEDFSNWSSFSARDFPAFSSLRGRSDQKIAVTVKFHSTRAHKVQSFAPDSPNIEGLIGGVLEYTAKDRHRHLLAPSGFKRVGIGTYIAYSDVEYERLSNIVTIALSTLLGAATSFLYAAAIARK